MNSIQVADETFVAADGATVGAAVADPASWRRWWPDLRLQVIEERGATRASGGRSAGPLTGTMEIWLEPMLDGVLLHYFLHAEPAGATAWQLAKMDLAKITHQPQGGGQTDVLRDQERARGRPPGRGGARRA